MANYKKLELTWYNKDKVYVWDEKKCEYIWVDQDDIKAAEIRILKETKIIGEPNSEWNAEKNKWVKTPKLLPKKEKNLLIKGDNYLALKTLEEEYTERFKLIYIDPPFNTGARIDADGEEVSYEDGLEHSIWLSIMRNEIEQNN